ncbi:hypothetical protein IFR23_02505 [Sphingomonas sp. CFBP 13603]|uniref:hypothetical protein n=1 Tax=Sphingomonas sp. CFBP 13603 TaxID=2774040 RepID=UPI0018672415|nr:hypothetical protein [Sphingomonas sp. CFBP 13603]MBE2990879.1 hypothetical protein [Sphingomonas sp. CFBP 13603]
MAIPREAMRRAVDAGHPDTALIGVPVSLMREILKFLPVEMIVASTVPTAPQGTPA